MSAHKFCTHPATKSARAACRKAAGSTLNTARLVRETGTEDDRFLARLESESIEREAAESAPALGHVVTRSTWKGYRNFRVAIHVTVWGAQPDTEFHGKIVAWGEKRLSYVSATGTRNTIDASRVKRVEALGV